MNWYKKSQQTIRLWVDDERNPKDPIIQQKFGSKGDEVWVTTAQEAINLLSQGNVAFISFDHDLGSVKKGNEGYAIAKFIEEKAYFKEIQPPAWTIHSQNPVGAKNIADAMKKAEEYWNN